jgi:exodeoxyribonuclease (lambda-induced)
MIIHEFEQGTEEWFKIRLGKLTGSNAQAIASNGKGLETLVFEKVAEIMTGKMKAQYTNEDIQRGNELEYMARNSYELETGNLVKKVGFCELDEMSGCSPDGLIGDDGIMEIKCKSDATFARFLYEQKVESAHNWQMQFNLFVTEREYCDYVVFNENFPKTTVIIKVPRNESEIAKLKAGLMMGKAQIKSILEKIKQ